MLFLITLTVLTGRMLYGRIKDLRAKKRIKDSWKKFHAKDSWEKLKKERDKKFMTMYSNEPEYIVKLKGEAVSKAIAIVDLIKENHPNAKICIEMEP